LTAHADEKGLYARKVHEDGLVAFDSFGLDRRCLPAQAVEIHTSTTRAPGVIQAALLHHAGDREVIDPSEMRIDVGAMSREQAEALGIRPGDPVTFLSSFTCLSGNLVTSKALDNRAGLFAAMVALKRCYQGLAGPAVLAATRQEECGMRGGGPASCSVKPRAAIVVDIIGGQVYGYKERESREMLGKGVIVHYDPGVDRAMRDRALEVASAKGIRHQVHAMSGIGADALAIGQSAEGVPVLELFIPALHFHTPRALVDLSDVCSTVDLVESLLTDRCLFDLMDSPEQ
jgi:endoglucanase